VTAVAVAIGRESWEPELVAALTTGSSGVHVARRCVDAVDLSAVAMGGLAEVVIIGSRLPRIDLNLVAALGTAGVHVMGVAADDVGANRLRTLGVSQVVKVDPSDLDLTVHSIAALAGEMRLANVVPNDDVAPVPAPTVGGRITVVIGAAGAPGRTTIAANLAAIWADSGASTLLMDADTDAPAIASVLGVMTDEPGLARAARAALEARDDVHVLHRAVSRLGVNLSLLSGAAGGAAADVLRPSAIERVVTVAAAHHDHVVVDTASWRAGDMQLGGTGAGQPLRTLMGLADSLLIVGSADPIGLVRLLGLLTATQHEAPQACHFLVLNKARGTALGGAESEITEMLGQHVPLPETLVLPDDRIAADNAMLRGQPLVTVAPKSKAAQGISCLATLLAQTQTADASPSQVKAMHQRVTLRSLVARRAS
jgi:MinD-like ATPase involved in chromosome partitioning or flagellar assembly